MKGKSQRLQNSDPPDDWVDGSWTVDCICGVNFDDGEEMVNCDECGVWVHTRCYRYVKSQESFACDKCKSEGVDGNDSEETEVAQLLVELPTKTIRREASYGNSVGVPSKRPFRLWAEMPMEEKVHVQGIPGGDPVLFSGLSSVFSPQLWKCAGYVPKKFNFQYREFPCWDDDCKDKVANVDEDNDNAVDRGAGVLFSLSKESGKVDPGRSLAGLRSKDEEVNYESKGHLKESKKWEAADIDVRCSLNGVKKNRTLLRPIVIHTGKRKKEEPGAPKDLMGKKKARIADNDIDAKRRSLQSSKTVFSTTSDAKQLEFCEDRRPKSFKTDIGSVKNRNLRDSVPLESVSCGPADPGSSELLGKPLESLGVIRLKGSLSAKSEDPQRKLSSLGGTKVLSSSNHHPDPVVVPKMILGENVPSERPDGSSSGRVRKVPEDDSAGPGHKITVDPTGPDFSSNDPAMVMQHNVKTELSPDDVKRADNIPSAYHTLESPAHLSNDSTEFQTNNDKTPQNLNYVDVDRSCLVSGVVKSSGTALTMEAVTECRVNTGDELSGVLCEQKQEVDGSEGTVEAQEIVLESNDAFVTAKGLFKPVAIAPSEALKSNHKSVACEKADSSHQNSAVMATQVDNVKPLDYGKNCSVMKKTAGPDRSQTAKSEPAIGDVSVSDGRQDSLRKSAKDRPSTPSASKGSPSSRTFSTPFSKRTANDAKDSITSSSKSSSSQNAAVSSGSGESAGTVRNQNASHAQSKVTPPGLPQRGGKHHAHPPPSSSSKLNNALSDEELALLLHQELNSSPRVPRVPRVRHAGSYAQLASQATPCLLVKRASSSGSKDQNLPPRRKNKDMLKDGVHSTRVFDADTNSPDQRKQDTVHRGDRSRRDANGTTDPSKRKNPSLKVGRSSGPSSSTEAENNKFSLHRSRESDSDDDSETAEDKTHRTLPELLDEIMSKGKRMTCDELYNAVLPHWHNLRKQNGERYAYSSPSQAALDCLRNRPDWARLVDRGPKTISVKKRRLDTVDSDDNEDGKPRTTRETESRSLESQHEEFPKGKRKARKRRRLALQGRGVKDLRNRRKLSRFNEEEEEEEEAYSESSEEENAFSEDEMEEEEEGKGGGSGGSEASISSDATEKS
ncbi:hypothetical protein MLD38_027703 [Melastoma candidum]|uniref:Uncharacterized protein n=1 Tax=Melastoma candidum TaxID=119954 RepID=A0ACB9P2F2_9MYRT|nr:hypothetical protein MLD38_027703 [Melastoma candidum]